MTVRRQRERPPNPGYTLPLRKREAIAGYLAYADRRPAYSTRHSYNGGHGDWGLFCFDVKARHLDLSLAHLTERWVKWGEGQDEPHYRLGSWQKQAQAAYDRITYHGERGQEALARVAIEEARDDVNDTDSWKCLWWLGDAEFAATYDFLGRSGGHMRLATWSAYTRCGGAPAYGPRWEFTDEDPDHWYEVLKGNPHREGSGPYQEWVSQYGTGMTWYELQKLYATIRMLEWDFQVGRAEEMVEDAAAYRLFASYLDALPVPELPRRILIRWKPSSGWNPPRGGNPPQRKNGACGGTLPDRSKHGSCGGALPGRCSAPAGDPTPLGRKESSSETHPPAPPGQQ